MITANADRSIPLRSPNGVSGWHASSRSRSAYRLSGLCALILGAWGSTYAADQPGPAPVATAAEAPAEALPEVTVTGSRIRRPGLETPTPVTSVTADDLQDLSPGQLINGLSQLPQFTNNQTPQTNAPLFSGGSNLNLRNAGTDRTLVLLNGRRLPSGNRYGAVDVSTLPQAAVTSVETVTGGASAAYGTDAVAGVVNFIVDTKYNGFKSSVEVGETSRDDGRNASASVTWGHSFLERGHVLISADYFSQDPIWSLRSLEDRPWYGQRALVTDPSHQFTYITRDFVAPTNTTTTGIINAPGTPLDKLVFVRNPDGTVGTQPLPYTGVGQLNGGCNCYAAAQRDPTYGIDADNAIQNENRRKSAFLYVDYDVTDNTNVYFQGIYGLSGVTGPWFEVPVLEGAAWGGTIFSGNPYLPASVQQIMTKDNISSVGFGETGLTALDNPGGLGTYTVDDSDELMTATVGFTTKFGKDGKWKLDGYGQFGTNHQDMHFENGIYSSRLFLALDAVTNPATGKPACRAALVNPAAFGDCVPVDLFGGVNSVSAAAKNYLVDPSQHVLSDYDQIYSEFVLNGPIYQGVGAGDFLTALGVSYRRDSVRQWASDICGAYVCINGVSTGYRGLIPENMPNGMLGVRAGSVPPGFIGNNSLANDLFTGSILTPDTVLDGAYSVKEAFTEFDLPLLKDKPFARALDTNLAYRWADYSGSGGIPSWKYGFSWQVFDEIRIRATKSRDVRAANIRERFDATAGGSTVADPLNGNIATNSSGLTVGNPNVSPEKADTVTYGAVFQPGGFLQGFSASVDWYDIQINDAIGTITQQNIVNWCADGSAPQLCQYVVRAPPTGNQTAGTILSVNTTFLNLADQRIRGADGELRYDHSIHLIGGNERLGGRAFINHVAENSQLVQGTTARDFLSLEQPAWTILADVIYMNGPLRTFLEGRWLDGHTLNRTYNTGLPGSLTVDDNWVSSVFYMNLNLSYDFSWSNVKVTAFGSINNLLDRAPPQTPTLVGAGGTALPSELLYDTIGRAYTIGFKVAF